MERRDYQLNGKLYSLLLPPATRALPLCTRAMVLISPFAGMLKDFKTLADPAAPKDLKLAACLTELGKVLTLVDPDAVNKLMMDAVSVSHLTCDDKPISGALDFDRHFSEHRSDVYQVLLWNLWECVQDFFPQLGGIAQKMRSAANQSLSQTDGATTTG